MFKCTVCGSIGQNPGRCGICGREVREIRNEHTPPSESPLAANQSKTRSRRFWTGTRIVAFIALVVVAISSAGAATYLSARPAGPSCKNSAINYPSCDACGSWGIYNSFTNLCQCSNGFINPPSCDRSCGNGAINGPANSPKGEIGCDECPNGQTTDYGVPCRPFMPPDNYGNESKTPSGYPPT